VLHWLTWEATTAAANPIAETSVMTAVRQVDGRVRSFVHSPLRALVSRVARTAGPEGVV
jgi:hypothetical protein